MAVVQISRIQVRRGPVSDLPKGTPTNPVGLREGEFGFASDNGTLFVGSPNLTQVQGRKPTDSSPGQFPFANTQILTEFSRNPEELVKYQYRYRRSLGNTDFPGPGSTLDWAYDQAKPWGSENTPIVRFLQERLDEMVSVKAYGAQGDGVTDDTYAIWRAAIDTTREHVETTTDGEHTTAHRRMLYFPAGVYVISRPAILPPYSTWVGDGIGKTIIILRPSDSSFQASCVVETVDGRLELENILDNWHLQVPEHLRYTEIQIGDPTGTSDGTIPTNISVDGITFKHAGGTGAKDVLRLNRSSNTTWMNCRFEGSYCDDNGTLLGASKLTYTYGQTMNRLSVSPGSSGGNASYSAGGNTPDSIAVFIDGLGSMVEPHDHLFSGCEFASTTYAFSMTSFVHNIVIQGCSFDRHYRGVSIGEIMLEDSSINRTKGLHTEINQATLLPGQVGGPTNIRITNSTFRRIVAEALWVNYGANIVSLANTFENTIGRGNGFNTNNTPITPVVYFSTLANDCSSIGDYIERSDAASGSPANVRRVLYDPFHSHMVINGQDSPNIPDLVSRTMTTAFGIDTTPNLDTGLYLPITGSECYRINYLLIDPSAPNKPRRIGELNVMISWDGQNPMSSPVVISDQIKVEYLTTGFTFTGDVIQQGSDYFVRVLYTNASSSSYMFTITVNKFKIQ